MGFVDRLLQRYKRVGAAQRAGQMKNKHPLEVNALLGEEVMGLVMFPFPPCSPLFFST